MDAESGEVDEIPEEPKKDYGRSVRLYKRILRDYPDYEFLDGTYYMLGYLSESASAQYDEEQGLAVFQGLVDRLKSRFARSLTFASASTTSTTTAGRGHSQLPAGRGTRAPRAPTWGSTSVVALQEVRIRDALVLLNRCLVVRGQLRGPVGNAHGPEAVDYTAISFSDLADRESVSPLAISSDSTGMWARRNTGRRHKKLMS